MRNVLSDYNACSTIPPKGTERSRFCSMKSLITLTIDTTISTSSVRVSAASRIRIHEMSLRVLVVGRWGRRSCKIGRGHRLKVHWRTATGAWTDKGLVTQMLVDFAAPAKLAIGVCWLWLSDGTYCSDIFPVAAAAAAAAISIVEVFGACF